jgi:pimeloyl-ACP methyl ester carboxylesterase
MTLPQSLFNGRSQARAHRRRVGNDEIAYREVGAGPPLVLIHGLSASGWWWSRNLDALARHFHVHVIDLVGFGRSRNGGRFVLTQAADQIVRWMDALGMPKASVVGHSMGGFIAAELAARQPARVDRLVLVDAAVLPLSKHPLRLAGGALGFLRYAPVTFTPILLTDAVRAGPITLLRASWQLLSADLRDVLPQIAAPTLVVWGERDSLVPLALGRDLAARLPGARLVTFPGVGHNPMWDRPHEFNRVVLDFLTRPPDRCPEATTL